MAAVARSVSRGWGRFEQRLPERARRFLNHPAGPKTIFFWAPTFKWATRAAYEQIYQHLHSYKNMNKKGLVIAGLADVTRPAEKLSLKQSGALAATGTIWARYSLVIDPINYNLFAVNVFVAFAGYFQLYRIWEYRNHRNKSEPSPPPTQS